MAQDDRKNQTNSPGLYEQFAEIVNPEVQKMMSNALSGWTYSELFQKASNSVLKRLGLLSPTSGLTTPENQIDPYRVLAANGSKNTSVFDDVEAHVQQTNSFNPYNETQQPNDPEDREEHKRTQHLAILEANQMFDALLQENDFQIDPLSNYERAAYTSHMLGKPQDQRAALAKKFLNKDPKALGDLNPINALLAGFDPYAQLEDLEVPANIAAGVDGVVSSDLGPVIQKGFDSLAKSEGPDIHLDGRNFLTLPYGIVPDKNSVKKADGTPFDPTAVHKLGKDDLSGIDYSKATKFGISREDFTTDEGFAKAVFDQFAAKTKKKYGSGFTALDDGAKQAAYDMSWNAGIGSVSWSSVKDMLKESSKKDNADKSTEILIGFTANFRSGTDYPRGLLKRRLQTYNLVAKPGEEATMITTTAIMKNNNRTGTKYDIKKSDGSVIKSWEKPDNNERLGDLAVN
tara:strand:+ start:733 stop:2109 length:1377 start_codon:yes stop_codon:yes gene_type:complete